MTNADVVYIAPWDPLPGNLYAFIRKKEHGREVCQGLIKYTGCTTDVNTNLAGCHGEFLNADTANTGNDNNTRRYSGHFPTTA